MCFYGDITATATAKLVRVNRKTVNNYYNAIREKILAESLKEMSVYSGEFEADEPYTRLSSLPYYPSLPFRAIFVKPPGVFFLIFSKLL